MFQWKELGDTLKKQKKSKVHNDSSYLNLTLQEFPFFSVCIFLSEDFDS